jgi:DNA-binding Xre family transcriptional regulator
MAVSYNNLWKLLIDKKMNKSELCKKVKISSSTMAKMTNEEVVAMPVLEKICAELECNIGDIVSFTELEDVKKKLHEDIENSDNRTANMEE